MKSFRGERQQKKASAQVILAVVVMLTSILLVNFLPGDRKVARTQKTHWESSVIKLP